MDELEKAEDIIQKLEARNAELEEALQQLIEQCEEHEYALWGVNPGEGGQSVAIAQARAALTKKEPANG